MFGALWKTITIKKISAGTTNMKKIETTNNSYPNKRYTQNKTCKYSTVSSKFALRTQSLQLQPKKKVVK